jgi:hypothetical protein
MYEQLLTPKVESSKEKKLACGILTLCRCLELVLWHSFPALQASIFPSPRRRFEANPCLVTSWGHCVNTPTDLPLIRTLIEFVPNWLEVAWYLLSPVKLLGFENPLAY